MRDLTNDELFERYDAELKLRHRSERALWEARRVLGHFRRFIGESPPSASLAKAYLAQFQHVKVATFARYVAVLKKFCQWIGDPIEDLTVRVPQQVPEYVRPGDVERLLIALRAESKRTHKGTAARDVLLVETAIKTGLRRGELAALHVEDVNLEAGLIRVWDGKGHKTANVQMPPSLVEAMRLFLDGRGRDESVFNLAPASISGKIKRAAMRAGVKLHTHSLRHRYIESLEERNVQPTQIRLLARHSSLRTTQLYMGLRDGSLEDAVKLLDKPSGRSQKGGEAPHSLEFKFGSGTRDQLEDLKRQLRRTLGTEPPDAVVLTWSIAFTHAFTMAAPSTRVPLAVDRQMAKNVEAL